MESIIGEAPKLESAELVYVVSPTDSNKLVLAWEILDDQGNVSIVDAVNGRILTWVFFSKALWQRYIYVAHDEALYSIRVPEEVEDEALKNEINAIFRSFKVQ